jgi:hypothetical protein
MEWVGPRGLVRLHMVILRSAQSRVTSFGQFGRKELYLGQAFRRRRDMARPLLGQVSAQKSVIASGR